MTYATSMLAPNNNTATTFRAWGSGISALIVAAGLVATTDTGQINWTTVAAPGAANTSMGYEIYKFPDSLQTTNPIFVKVEYGSSINGATSPQMWITIGTATDGAGTITSSASFPNSTTPRTPLGENFGANWQSTSTFINHCNYTDGEFYLMSFPGAASGQCGWFMWIGRTRDADGTSTGDAYSFTSTFASTGSQAGLNGSGTGTIMTYCRHFLGAAVAQGSNIACGLGLVSGLWSASMGAAASATQWFSPYLCGITYKAHGPSKLILVCYKNDVPLGAALTVTHYGSAHTWVGFGSYSTTMGHTGGGNNGAAILRTD